MTECPHKYAGAETWRLLHFADLYKAGIPPVAGGALDQLHVFNEAARFAWAEDEYWKAKLNPLGTK